MPNNIDLGVFERQKTLIDQQQLQDAFNLKKALAIQSAQREALETQALQSQAANGGLTLKDLLSLQFQQQNAQESNSLKQQDIEARRQTALENRQFQQQNAADSLALRKEALAIQRMNAAAAAANRVDGLDSRRSLLEDKAAEARQKKIEAEAERYGKTLESTGLSDLLGAVDRAANVVAGEGNIAGYGAVTNALPSLLVSEEGKANRQEISGLRNTLLKARSGGAVTPQEASRLSSEIGDNIGSDSSLLRKGVGNISRTIAEKLANARAGFSPEAIDLYEKRGGIGSGFVDKYLNRGATNAPAAAKPRLKYNPATGDFE